MVRTRVSASGQTGKPDKPAQQEKSMLPDLTNLAGSGGKAVNDSVSSLLRKKP